MTVTRNRVLPTGVCFCGCGLEAEVGRWFVRGHDITAAAALRALQGRTLPERLADAGFGPQRSVVAEAEERAGWQRCGRCPYAGPPAALAAHHRGEGCTGAETAVPGKPPAAPAGVDPQVPGGNVGAEGEAEVAAGEQLGQEPLLPAVSAGGPGPAAVPAPRGGATVSGPDAGGREQDAGPAVAGVARGLVLPGADDPLWQSVPVELRSRLRSVAYRMASPLKGPLARKENTAVLRAVRAAARSKNVSGHQWRALLTAPREVFGNGRSERAARFYDFLEVLVAEYVKPALGEAAGAGKPAAAAPAGHGAPPAGG